MSPEFSKACQRTHGDLTQQARTLAETCPPSMSLWNRRQEQQKGKRNPLCSPADRCSSGRTWHKRPGWLSLWRPSGLQASCHLPQDHPPRPDGKSQSPSVRRPLQPGARVTQGRDPHVTATCCCASQMRQDCAHLPTFLETGTYIPQAHTQYEDSLQHSKHGSVHNAVLGSSQQVSIAGRADAH